MAQETSYLQEALETDKQLHDAISRIRMLSGRKGNYVAVDTKDSFCKVYVGLYKSMFKHRSGFGDNFNIDDVGIELSNVAKVRIYPSGKADILFEAEEFSLPLKSGYRLHIGKKATKKFIESYGIPWSRYEKLFKFHSDINKI